MKVTKIIREYVEERVNEIFAEPTAIEREYEEKQKQFKLYIEKLNTEINNFIDSKVKELEKNNPDNLSFCRNTSKTYIYDGTDWRCNETENSLSFKARKAKEEREAQCYKAKKNIFVNLELGANKEQLESMFQKLIEEKNNTITIEE